MKKLSCGFKLPKVGYEVCIYEIDDIHTCVDSETFYSQLDVKKYLEKFDSEKYHFSVALIGGCSSW